MTKKIRPHKKLIILAGTLRQAHAVGERLGLTPAEILWPRVCADLQYRHGAVPLYVHWSLAAHPDAAALGEYVSMRWRAVPQPMLAQRAS